MAGVLTSRTLTISLTRHPSAVYEFVANPENLPRWAKAFCRSIRKSKGRWIAETPQGPVAIRIAGKNRVGVLDHHVIPSAGPAVFVPMRVIPNGRGSEVLFTLFRLPGMSAARYATDLRLVRQDLQTLKRVMKK